MTERELKERLAHVHPLTQFSTAWWLHRQAEKIGCEGLCIEVGVWAGFTAIAMALGGPRVIAIDPFDARGCDTESNAIGRLMGFYTLPEKPDIYSIFLDNILKADVRDRIFAIKAISAHVIPPVECAEMVFIDGDHTKEGITADLHIYAPAVKPGGLLVVDNVKDTKDVKSVFLEFIKEKGWADPLPIPGVSFYTTKPEGE